jgi:transcriptional regulator with XRE-family HTH domain
MSRAKEKILNKEIGKKIREARNVKPLVTQTKLGKALNVTFQQIQKYESGHNGLSSIKLLEVCNFFNKPLEYFTSDATELLEKVRPTDNSSVKVSESLENV